MKKIIDLCVKLEGIVDGETLPMPRKIRQVGGTITHASSFKGICIL